MRCPKFEQIVDYLDNRLTEAESAHVRAHLATDCQTCTETRAWYEGVRAIAASDESIEPPTWVLKRAVRIFEAQHNRPRLVERIGQAVASLVFDSFARPAVSGVRSTETTNRQLLYRAGDYSIDLQIAPSGQSRADLIGQVLREGETTFESVSGCALKSLAAARKHSPPLRTRWANSRSAEWMWRIRFASRVVRRQHNRSAVARNTILNSPISIRAMKAFPSYGVV